MTCGGLNRMTYLNAMRILMSVRMMLSPEIIFLFTRMCGGGCLDDELLRQ